eukprot:Gb_01650 [translate_table: standard]
MASCATKPCLHLISYTNTSSLPHTIIHTWQVPRRHFYCSTNTLYSFCNKTSNAPRSSKVNEILNVFSILLPVRTMNPSIWVWVDSMMDSTLHYVKLPVALTSQPHCASTHSMVCISY